MAEPEPGSIDTRSAASGWKAGFVVKLRRAIKRGRYIVSVSGRTAQGDETTPCPDSDARYFGAIRDALESWQRGAAPPISVHDCLRAVRLIDQAYALAK